MNSSTSYSFSPEIRAIFLSLFILLLNPATFAFSQPLTFISNDDEDRIPIPPVLFRAIKYTSILDLEDDGNPFDFAYRKFLVISSGLYTDSSNYRDVNIAGNGVRLMLPYRVGEHDFAKRSNNKMFENSVELYQHEYQAFGVVDTRAQRLVKIFESGSRWWRGEIGRLTRTRLRLRRTIS